MAEPEFMQMGKSFVGFYYPAFANDRAQLANVYTDQVFTEGLELSCCGFSTISRFLERIPMEHIESKVSLES